MSHNQDVSFEYDIKTHVCGGDGRLIYNMHPSNGKEYLYLTTQYPNSVLTLDHHNAGMLLRYIRRYLIAIGEDPNSYERD